MFEDNSKMDEALAEILGVDVKLIEMLQLEYNVDLSKEGMIYGYYIDFPKESSFEIHDLNDFTADDIEKIPWGQSENYEESKFGNTKADPFNWRKDWEEEQYLLSLIPSKERIVQQIIEIESKIKKNISDHIIVKALLFSAFSFYESFIRKLVFDSIPAYDDISPLLKPILSSDINSKLNKADSRKKLYKDLTGKKIKELTEELTDVRNFLAHNMFKAEIILDEIKIKNKKEEEISFNVFTLLNSLKEYIKHPIN